MTKSDNKPERHDPELRSDGQPYAERPNKSALKRESDELQSLGEALIAMAPSELDQLNLPEKLRDAVDVAKRITAHGGLYRQKQYIGKLMRALDVTPIRAALDLKKQKQRTEVLRFKRIEQWRERLRRETGALDALMQQYPNADRAQLESLLIRARYEDDHGQPPAASREMFTVLRELME